MTPDLKFPRFQIRSFTRIFSPVIRISVLVLVVLIAGIVIFQSIKSGKEQKILNSPVIIKKVKSIQKFIGTEFYGEVIADLEEVYLDLEDTYNYIQPDSTDLSGLTVKDSVNLLIIKRILGKNFEKGIKKGKWPDYKKYYRYIQSIKKDKMQLVYIGRGWVKCGIDLQKMKPGSITRIQDSIIIKLPAPEILYADINPWFSEERNIKGFEIFINKKERKIEPYEVLGVKLKCKEKLMEEALKKGILKKTEQSAIRAATKILKLFGYQKFSISFEH